MVPKDLKLCPNELYCSEGELEITERTMVFNWVKQWLTYCHWYYGTALSPDVTLESFFQAPEYTIHWDIKQKDENLVRFDLMWKL